MRCKTIGGGGESNSNFEEREVFFTSPELQRLDSRIVKYAQRRTKQMRNTLDDQGDMIADTGGTVVDVVERPAPWSGFGSLRFYRPTAFWLQIFNVFICFHHFLMVFLFYLY